MLLRWYFYFLSLFIIIHAEMTSIERDDPNNDNLICAITMSRHGQRTPVKSYPKDPLNIQWPAAPGELMNEGKRLHYNLGRWLRARFKDFLPYKYSEKDVLVHSTDVDRVIMSGLSNLAGLFPPKGNAIWNKNLLWQPIPIHITEPYILTEFVMDYCPQYEKLLRVDNSSKHNPINQENQRIYKYLQEHSGEEINDPVSVYPLRDVLYIERDLGYTLPDWTKPVYPGQMNRLVVEMMRGMAETKELARLSSGPFLTEIVNHFDKMIQNGTQKFRMFFGHDVNIVCILSGLSSYPDDLPEYGATIIFELHRTGNNKHYVRIDYMYEFGKPPLEIRIPGCDVKCDFEKFKKIINWVLIDKNQWDKECNIK